MRPIDDSDTSLRLARPHLGGKKVQGRRTHASCGEYRVGIRREAGIEAIAQRSYNRNRMPNIEMGQALRKAAAKEIKDIERSRLRVRRKYAEGPPHERPECVAIEKVHELARTALLGDSGRVESHSEVLRTHADVVDYGSVNLTGHGGLESPPQLPRGCDVP